MSIPDENPPDRDKPCPLCQNPGREATAYEQTRTGKAHHCDSCNLAYSGTASEFQRYRVQEAVQAAERMATSPTKENRP